MEYPDRDTLVKYLIYVPETGVFINRITRSTLAKEGHVAGTVDKNGYVFIYLGMQRLLAHRLAWLYMYGSYPESQIDHINRNRSDNRISNLRLCTASENGYNTPVRPSSKTGIKGASWCPRRLKWVVYLKAKGKPVFRKRYDRLEDAVEAVRQARDAHHGAFATH